MAGGRSDSRTAKARELRDRMRADGFNADAEVIDGVLRSFAATRSTLKTLHRDNMELRQRLGLPSFLDQSRT